jgi:hypothetical protein
MFSNKYNFKEKICFKINNFNNKQIQLQTKNYTTLQCKRWFQECVFYKLLHNKNKNTMNPHFNPNILPQGM